MSYICMQKKRRKKHQFMSMVDEIRENTNKWNNGQCFNFFILQYILSYVYICIENHLIVIVISINTIRDG